MATVSLSSGVRAALGSLSSVKADATSTQYRLSTGKKVNSAVDDPVNFFTAAGLNDRAAQLTSNLDGISNGIQTITAASQGIDSITKLVQSLQSTIKQAQADNAANRPTVTELIPGATTRDNALNSTVAAAGSITLSAGSTQYTVTVAATDTVRDTLNKINQSGVATASVDNSGKLTVTGTGSNDLVIAGADAVLGTTTLNGTKTGATANSSVRANLVDQFNDLTKQIDQLAKDAGFNGKNLLTGDKLSIVFNEKTGANQAKLDVQGQTITSANLGIGKAVSGNALTGEFNIQDDASLSTAADTLTNALTALRSTSSSLGASLSTVQTRQDFTKNLANTLTAGADNLVQADTNQEAANLLALQTRQQLSQTALSLSNQADQAILRLF